MPRTKTSPYRYDRAEIRAFLEQHGRDAALARWPRDVVDPIARLLGLIRPYLRAAQALTPEQVRALGTKPDATIAAEHGLALSTVNVARRRLGIPACTKADHRARAKAVSDAELGLMTLKELYARTGIPVTVLMAERRRRRLPLGRGQRLSAQTSVTEMRCVAVRAVRAAFPTVTLNLLGEVFGLTRERIRQLEQLIAIEQQQAS